MGVLMVSATEENWYLLNVVQIILANTGYVLSKFGQRWNNGTNGRSDQLVTNQLYMFTKLKRNNSKKKAK